MVFDIIDVAVCDSVCLPFPVFSCVDLDEDSGAVLGFPFEDFLHVEGGVLVVVDVWQLGWVAVFACVDPLLITGFV